MPIDPHDRQQIEHLLTQVRATWRNPGALRGLPGGGMVMLSNGLQVTLGLEAGEHSGEGGPGEIRLWLGVSRPDRFPTFSEMQALIAVVFSASQRGAANPLAISTGRQVPYLVLCSSRISRGDSRAA
ncbi:MAG TPA: hypothetical protein VM536_15805 [Chloroflexia bacterium]|nr:hypothetical protein [Chloroflexia bacterium]